MNVVRKIHIYRIFQLHELSLKELLRTILPFLSFGRVVYRVPWAKEVFLTFDDGPDPDFTPAVLDVLNEYSIPATFFLLGSNAQAYPQLVAEIIKQGHTVANHTFSHINLSKSKFMEIIRELRQCRQIVPEQFILRPPYGGINVRTMLLAIVLRYKLVFWSVDSLDYKKIPVKEVVANVMKEDPKWGDIILFHDMNENTIEALPIILDRLLIRGLSFGLL